MTFPVRLLTLRQRLELPQRILAGRLGVTVQTVSNWECGRTEPRGKALQDTLDKLITLERELSTAARPRVCEALS